MATIKSHTDISQSKKLAEILPLESADGFYEAQHNPITNEWEDILFTGTKWASKDVVIPAWSLAALLDFISLHSLYNLDYDGIAFVLTVKDFEVIGDNLIDVCYEMILKLHEQKLL